MGGRSQLASIVAGLSVIVAIVALGGILSRFPTPALAGLVVFAGLRLVDIAGLRRLGRFRPTELVLALASAAGVLAAGVLAGILIAIALSVMDLFARVARPSAAILGRAPGVAGLHDIRDYPDAVTIPGLVVFRYDAPLCFANASDFKARALHAALHQPEPVEWLLLNAEANVEVDLTAAGLAIDRGFNRIAYARMFLATMKPRALAKWRQHPGLFDLERVRRARTLYEFDDAFTAPVHGFKGTDDYWARASAMPHLRHVRIPALLLNAGNDPFVPAASLPRPHEVAPSVTLWQPAHGGHVGFPGGRFPGHVKTMPAAVADWLAPHA